MHRHKPIILLEDKNPLEDLEELRKKNIFFEFDIYKEQVEELYEVSFPSRTTADYDFERDIFINEKIRDQDERIKGAWVYFPYTKTLVHCVSEQDLYKLVTNRNKNLITEREQEILKNFTCGFAGLSIGSSMAINLAYSGLSAKMNIVDFDSLETTNLNRVKARLSDIGRKKSSILAQAIYEVNPFSKLFVEDRRLDGSNIENFFNANGSLDLVFDAIDDFKMKVSMRVVAKNKRVPVVMLTNLGDRILIDIERYDLNPDLELFNGAIGSLPSDILDMEIDFEEEKKLAAQVVGVDNVPKRALDSLGEIRKSLVGRPQLMGTVSIASGLASYIVRKIALKSTDFSGRLLVDLDSFGI